MMDDKVSIPRNLAKRLERVTRKAGVTPSVLVRTALDKQRAQHFARKPGAWSALPKAKADWDTPATNAAIADALTGGELP